MTHPNENPANRRCETCRFAHFWGHSGDRECPPDEGIDCNLADNPEDYDPAEVDIPNPAAIENAIHDGEGTERPCSFWKEWETCPSHNCPAPPYGCPECENEANEAMARDFEEIDRLAKKAGF